MSDPVHVVCPSCDTVNRVPAARLGDRPVCGTCRSPLFPGKPIELNGPRLDQHVAASHVPLLVDLWAPWCGPCRMMAPVFEQAAATLEPRVRVAKLNTDDNPEIASRLNIRSIPTMILFQGGLEVARQSGAMSLTDLNRWVETNL